MLHSTFRIVKYLQPINSLTNDLDMRWYRRAVNEHTRRHVLCTGPMGKSFIWLLGDFPVTLEFVRFIPTKPSSVSNWLNPK